MSPKKFSSRLYKRYNPWAVTTVLNRVNISNHYLMENPDVYGIDVLVVNEKMDLPVGGLELEVKTSWTSKYPFSTVHFLGRKKKYGGKHNFYIILSKNSRSALMISFDDLLKYNTEPKDNKYVKGEEIYTIPKYKCIWGWKDISKALNAHFWGFHAGR